MNSLNLLREVENSVLSEVEDARKYLIMQIGNVRHNKESVLQLCYHINQDCPISKKDRITKIILKKAEELKIPIVTSHLPE